jgi:hypothetical protein
MLPLLGYALVAGAEEAPSPALEPADAGTWVAPPLLTATPDAGTPLAVADDEAAEGSFTVRRSATPSEAAAAAVRPTMDSFAEQSTSEFKLGQLRARYSLNVFGDLGARIDSLKPEHPSFFLGNVDLLLGFHLEQGFSGVAELKFGVNTGNAQGTTPLGSIDLERFALRWENDFLFVELGREHSEVGYWNNAYHHGIWLQPTYARPRWIGFSETGLVPVHRIGLLGGVKAQVGPGQLRVSLSINNSRGLTRSDVRNRSDLLDLKMVFASVEYLGLFARELRVGLSGILDQIPAAAVAVRKNLPDVPIDEAIGSFYLAYVGAVVLVDLETFYVRHSHADQVWQNYGGFVVVSVNWRNLSPYAMVERIWHDGPGPSPFFVPVPATATGLETLTADNMSALSTDNLSVSLGLRYDFTTWTALKLEYRFTRFYDLRDTSGPGGKRVHEVTLSWNFGL